MWIDSMTAVACQTSNKFPIILCWYRRFGCSLKLFRKTKYSAKNQECSGTNFVWILKVVSKISFQIWFKKRSYTRSLVGKSSTRRFDA